MKTIATTLFFICLSTAVLAQKSNAYVAAVKAYQKKYVNTHEVVKGKARQSFRFYAVDEHYNVVCRFEKSADTGIVIMKTSGTKIPQKDFIRYGKLLFTIHDTAVQLTVYQSLSTTQNPQYKNYLFIPFTDVSTGDETYGSGRYIDILTTDIKNNSVRIDFNKAYNPYCAYTTGYNCPIPPRENNLPVAIKAGEMVFAQSAGH